MPPSLSSGPKSAPPSGLRKVLAPVTKYLPSRANFMMGTAITAAAAAAAIGTVHHNSEVEQQYTEYGTAETARCVGKGLERATDKNEKVDPGAICGDCRTSIAKSLDTYVPWILVNQTYTQPDKDLIQAEVRRGANLVCKGLGTKEEPKKVEKK